MLGGSDKLIRDEMLQAFNSLFQPEVVWRILKVIAEMHAPSQTVSYTRAAEIKCLLQEFGKGDHEFDLNYAKTGNALLSLGRQAPKILFFAHADEFSYLVGYRCDDGSWTLVPYCSHRAEVDNDAIALRYQPSVGRLEHVARGTIRQVNHGNESNPHFFPTWGSVQPGDRLVCHHPLSREGDIIQGSIDNAAGVAACLLAALALCQIAPRMQVAFAFTDEEEGPPVSNSTFARGARRLVQRLDPPDLCVNVDGHDISQWCSMGEGAVFAEKAALCKGGVVPPHLYARFKELADDMVARGVRITENPGYVSRSDDVACVEITPNILLLGYPVKNPHFNQAVPSASLGDILNLSKAVFWTAIEFGKLLGC
jgi:putative aminopeptidase FrvX